MHIRDIYNKIIVGLRWRIQYKILLPNYPQIKKFKIAQIRKKKQINVSFIISEIGKWKTEGLFLKMSQNYRFNPQLIVVPSQFHDENTNSVIQYLDKKGYHYHLLPKDKTITNSFKPDIIFYQEPYNGYYYQNHSYVFNLKALFCYVNYAFHSIYKAEANMIPLINNAWQVYYENESALNDLKKDPKNKTDNIVVTGLPISDLYLNFHNCDNTPWKEDPKKRKKIIWAPHHTIPGNDNLFIVYSTFLDYYHFMFEMAQKYQDKIVMAFKPHPALRRKLKKIWTEKEIEDYYNKWNSFENTQLVEGDYITLFMNSDAMIHDCSSFQIEYHYTHKPALYLTNDPVKHIEGMNSFAQKAFNLHYMGRNKKDIEDFIINVIKGHDPLKEQRDLFFKENLLPPHKKTSSENIIDSILGQGSYC